MDLQPTFANRVYAVFFVELLSDVIEKESLTTGCVVPVVLRAERLLLGGCSLCGADVTASLHRVEHFVASLGCARRVEKRVVRGWCLRKTGKQSALSDCQFAHRLVEVHPSCGLNSHCGLAADCAVSNVVHVPVEDPLL